MSDVLLLHAGIADHRMWEPQLKALEAAGHRALAPDLPGFGDAALEPGVVDYVAFAAAQLAGAAAVVGCSFGGRIALELAAARPDLVERLVLIGAGLGVWDWSESAQAGFAEEEEAIERGDLAAAAAQQARMWLASAAEPSTWQVDLEDASAVLQGLAVLAAIAAGRFAGSTRTRFPSPHPSPR